MTAKNRADIQTEIDALLANNTTGDISPTDVRTVHETSKDSNLNLTETVNQTVASKINGATITSETVRMGMMDYNDLATATTPISIPGTSTFIDITNDGAGVNTNKLFKVVGVGELWNTGTNLFDWTDLVLGDQVNIRLDLEVTTTSPNQLVITQLLVAVGGAPYTLSYAENVFKNTGAHEVNRFSMLYMGDTNTLNNGAKFQVSSDGTATVIVRGWALQHFLRN
jgi:hypothetical protein